MADGVSVIITVVCAAAVVAFGFKLSTRRARYAHRSIVRWQKQKRAHDTATAAKFCATTEQQPSVQTMRTLRVRETN